MLQTLKNAWSTKEIRSKILFTLFILLIYRVGTVIPVPFVEANDFASSLSGTILEYMNVLSGGSMGAMTLFALGVQPYINASIIIQLLAVVFPKLGELGKTDKKKMNFITRLVTVGLAVVTAIGYYFLLRNGNASAGIETFLTQNAYDGKMAWLYGIVIVVCYTAGASLVMWLAERINEKGIGNGISMILFANIVSAVPSFVYNLVTLVVNTWGYPVNKWLYGIITALFAVALIAFLLALIAFVIFVTGSERRIPVQYAKKVVGRKMYGGQSTNLPIKLNMTGVMPIIFASSIVSIPATIAAFFAKENGFTKFVNNFFSPQTWEYLVVYLILIIAFSYFYVLISFDPVEVSNNIVSNGGSVRGIRPGRPTVQYIQKILKRVTLIGAFFLCIVAGLPMLVTVVTTVLGDALPATAAAKIPDLSILTFGGSSLLIVVGVALETVRDLEAQLSLRASKGFLG